jgi:hypothetical protein
MYARKISAKGAKLSLRSLSSTPQQNLLIQQVTEAQKDRTARVVPWFLQNMPVSFQLISTIYI